MIRLTRKILLCSSLLLISLVFSCEKFEDIIVCSDCYDTEPLKAELNIQLDMNPENATEIIVYEGMLEDGIVYKRVLTGQISATIPVSVNRLYTVTASYNTVEKNITIVNSTTPRVKYSKDRCEEPCWYVYDRYVNLKLNY
jgi:hypothetical protein